MSFNPMQLICSLKGIPNPEAIVLNLLQNTNNPIAANVASLAQKHDYKGIEQIARNITKEQGKDFDTEFSTFRRQYGI